MNDLTKNFSADQAQVAHYSLTHALVDSSGTVHWIPQAHFKAFCQLDFHQWFGSTQYFSLQLGSWAHHGNSLNLTLKPDAVSPFMPFSLFLFSSFLWVS